MVVKLDIPVLPFAAARLVAVAENVRDWIKGVVRTAVRDREAILLDPLGLSGICDDEQVYSEQGRFSEMIGSEIQDYVMHFNYEYFAIICAAQARL
jgi:hypothetical protein